MKTGILCFESTELNWMLISPTVCPLEAGRIAVGMLCKSDLWCDKALVFWLTLVSQSLLNFTTESAPNPQPNSRHKWTVFQIDSTKLLSPSSQPWVNHTQFPPCLSPQTLQPQFRNSIPQPELGFTPFFLGYLNSQRFSSLLLTSWSLNTMFARFYAIL